MVFRNYSQNIVENTPVIHKRKKGRISVISAQTVDKLWKKQKESHKLPEIKKNRRSALGAVALMEHADRWLGVYPPAGESCSSVL